MYTNTKTRSRRTTTNSRVKSEGTNNTKRESVTFQRSASEVLKCDKDELIGALLACNIIMMVGFSCYMMAGSCNKGKYVVVDDEGADRDEKISF